MTTNKPERFDDSEILERLDEVCARVIAIRYSMKGWEDLGEANKALGWIAEEAYQAINKLYVDFATELERREAEASNDA